jgi:hypothetical protein
MKKKTSELFVSYCTVTPHDTEIGDVFTNVEEAEKENDKNNDNYEKVIIPMMGGLVTERTPRRPFKIMTLYDAIEKMKDSVSESAEHSERCRITGSEY